jgi:O-antigen/teichoic acid export membrane protein
MALKRVFLSAAALTASRVFQLVLSFAIVPVMTRLLTPAEYGLMAIAMAFVALTLYLSDSGMGRSLVRNSPDDVVAWSSAHWLVAMFTGALTLLLALAAYPAAWFFDEPRLAPMILVLSIMPLLHGLLEMPCNYLIQREKLWPIAASEVTSALTGAIVAIVLASHGAGVWALVAQQMAILAVKSALIFTVSGFRPRFVFDLKALGDHMGFARDTLGYALTSFVSKQTDPLVIGKILGPGPLGFYAIAYRIMAMPANVTGVPIQGAIYTRLVKLREDTAKLKTVVLAVTFAQSAALFPAITALAVSGKSAFTILLSERWAWTGEIFSMLAVAGMAQAVTTLNGAVLQALNLTGARLRLTLEFALIWLAAALVLVHFGVAAMAIGFSLVSLAYVPRLLHFFLKPMDCTYREYLGALAAPITVSLGIVASHEVVSNLLDLSNWETVLLAAAELLAAYGALALFARKDLLNRLSAVRAIFAAS